MPCRWPGWLEMMNERLTEWIEAFIDDMEGEEASPSPPASSALRRSPRVSPSSTPGSGGASPRGLGSSYMAAAGGPACLPPRACQALTRLLPCSCAHIGAVLVCAARQGFGSPAGHEG